MGEFGEQIGEDAVRFERVLPGPIERVWAFLTESDKRAQWLAGGDAELSVGGRIELVFQNSSLSELPDVPPPEKYADLPDIMRFDGVVTQCQPPNLLSHTWVDGEEASEVTYELEDLGKQVRLVLTHRRLKDRDSMLGVFGGWHTHLDILEDVLSSRAPQPFWERHTLWEREYEKLIAD